MQKRIKQNLTFSSSKSNRKTILSITTLSLSLFILSGCGNSETTASKPELAPICPEGFYRIEASKSCEILDEDANFIQ